MRPAPFPNVQLEFRPFAGINHSVRLRRGALEVRLSDLVHDAPPPVLEALATILLSKLYSHQAPHDSRSRYRRYLNSPAIRQRRLETRRRRGRKLHRPADGQTYNLCAMFADLNHRYFRGRLAQPRLGWSRNQARTMLGHFDAAHNVIVLSRSLDRAEVPRCAVEYVLYHEMLHIRHARHSPAFRRAEKKFAQYHEAKSVLKALGEPR